jgi:hypothetical protein
MPSGQSRLRYDQTPQITGTGPDTATLARMPALSGHTRYRRHEAATSLDGFVRARNFPGSGMSDTRRPVYWLAGHRDVPAFPGLSQWLQPHRGCVGTRSPLTVAGTAQFEALSRLSLAFPFNPFGHRRV